MDLNDFRWLLTPDGQEALKAAESMEPLEKDFLRHFSTLRRRYPMELARSALETALLRREATAKFPLAEKLYFTAEALEQASGEEVSHYRAVRFGGFRRLIDLGCSIGGDTHALAAAAPTIGIDIDPLRLAMAKANLAALGLGERADFLQADLSDPLPISFNPLIPRSIALFFDPARRAGGRRVFSVRDYRPPLEIMKVWQRRAPAAGVKISPGVDLAELGGLDCEIEFISYKGDLKEAVLWFGPLKTAHRRATLLPGPHSLSREAGLVEEERLRIRSPRAYLYEPDPSVLRAGLVTDLGAHLNAAQLDPDIAYLTADEKKPTPFARVWAVEDWFPFGLKRLRAWLRQRGVGEVVVKKRGSPLRPEALTRDLRLKGGEQRVVFLTHLEGKPIVVICYPNLPKGE